jgi:hypothetical protein
MDGRTLRTRPITFFNESVKAPTKHPKKSIREEHPAIRQEFPERLSELESALRQHSARNAGEWPLKAIGEPVAVDIDGQTIMQFKLGKNRYAAGHSDLTYSGSNHARGVRHIRFYAAEKVVLDIEGDFEDQQFGSNFRFQNIDCYLPGEWEADFLTVTDELRHHAEKRKLAFKKKRDARHRSQQRN